MIGKGVLFPGKKTHSYKYSFSKATEPFEMFSVPNESYDCLLYDTVDENKQCPDSIADNRLRSVELYSSCRILLLLHPKCNIALCTTPVR